MKKIIYLLVFIVELFFNLKIEAQSLHFSQYNELPSAFNPSSTGLIPNNNYRAVMVYKNQWNSIPVKYNTFGINTDFAIYQNSNQEGSWFGVGAYILKDEAGDGHLSHQKYQASLAYHAVMGENNTLSFGATYGLDNLSIEPDKLSYASQWDGKIYNYTFNNFEKFDYTSLRFSYLNIGLTYSYHNAENSNYFRIGYAIDNINRPVVTFLNTYSPVALRHFVNIEGIFKSSTKMIFTPIAYFSYQAKATEALLGGGVTYNLNSKEEGLNFTNLLGGLYYRIGDAVIPYFGYEQNKVRFTVSYDITASKLSQANSSLGGIEMIISVKGNYKNGNMASKGYACPRF